MRAWVRRGSGVDKCMDGWTIVWQKEKKKTYVIKITKQSLAKGLSQSLLPSLWWPFLHIHTHIYRGISEIQSPRLVKHLSRWRYWCVGFKLTFLLVCQRVFSHGRRGDRRGLWLCKHLPEWKKSSVSIFTTCLIAASDLDPPPFLHGTAWSYHLPSVLTH